MQLLNGLLLALVLFIGQAEAQFTQLSKAYHAGPQACGAKAVTTAFSPAVALVPPATNNLVLQITTNSTAGTVQITCNIIPPGQQLFSAKGIQVTAVAFLYGVQTTALTSIAAATLNTVTYPASTAAGAAAAGTVGTAIPPGTVTPTALQLTTTTSGQCFNEKVPLATPLILAADNQSLTFDQVFTTAGGAATSIQVCDVVVYYNEIVA